MRKFQCLKGPPPAQRPRTKKKALLTDIERFQREDDASVVEVVRTTFMPGTLSSTFSIRQPFKSLGASTGTKKGSLGPARLLTGGVRSKFLSGQDFSTANPVGAVPADDWNSDSDSASEAEDAAPEPPKIKEHEPLVLYEPTEEERSSGAQLVQVPPLLCQFLRPHQREGVEFVYQCVAGLKGNGGEGAILADDMGLGKTLQSIALMYTLLKCVGPGGEPYAKRAMVVCPCSLVKNWEDEFEKWINKRATTKAERVECMGISDAPRKTVEALIEQFLAPSNYYDVLVISYETFRAQHTRFSRSRRACDIVVCDEAHRLKNGDAQITKALSTLQTRRRVLLSGTPLQNDLQEYFALSNFTNPGIYGTRDVFARKYEHPILRSREPEATEAVRRKGGEAQAELSRIANTFIIRRMNRLNAQHLPPKLTQVVCCNLTPTQRAMYERLLEKRDDEQARKGSVKDTLSCIQRLQKVCNHPQLACEAESGGGSTSSNTETTAELRSLLPTADFAAAPSDNKRGRSKRAGPSSVWASSKTCDPSLSGKMLVLHRLMTELRADRKSKERIVVVSVFMTTLDLIEAMCQAEGWPHCKLGGSTSAKNRKKYNDEFNDPHKDYFAFLLSSKAGGCGLNLIGGSRLVMFDLDWNPATDKQAAARCWRDGQKLQCYTYRFVSTGTLEERMLQRQLSKEGLQNVIEDKAQVNHFATEDLKRLFCYRPKTASDLHDELGCRACIGRAAAKKNMDKGVLQMSAAATAECLETLRTQIIQTHPAAAHFLDFVPPSDEPPPLNDQENQPIDNNEQQVATKKQPKKKQAKAKKVMDLRTIEAKLEKGEYSLIPHVLRDLKLIRREADRLFEDPGAPQRVAARDLDEHVDALWGGLVDRLYKANNATNNQDDVGDDEDVSASSSSFKPQLYPLPKEEDLNNWSHHSSVASTKDAVLKRALKGIPGAVTFVFGMYQDWDLIQADTEMAKAKIEEVADDDEEEDDLEEEEVACPLSPAMEAIVKPKRKAVQDDSEEDESEEEEEEAEVACPSSPAMEAVVKPRRKAVKDDSEDESEEEQEAGVACPSSPAMEEEEADVACPSSPASSSSPAMEEEEEEEEAEVACASPPAPPPAMDEPALELYEGPSPDKSSKRGSDMFSLSPSDDDDDDGSNSKERNIHQRRRLSDLTNNKRISDLTSPSMCTSSSARSRRSRQQHY